MLGILAFVLFPREPEMAFVCSRKDQWHMSPQTSSYLYPEVDIQMTTYFQFENVNYLDLHILDMQLEMYHWGRKIGAVGQQGMHFAARDKTLVSVHHSPLCAHAPSASAPPTHPRAPFAHCSYPLAAAPFPATTPLSSSFFALYS